MDTNENKPGPGVTTRRDFIKKTSTLAAAVAATNLFKTPVYGQSQAPSTGRVIGANDRISVAVIGLGVGIGQSLDNPKEAALVIYVDRRNIPAELPPTVNGLRTRYVVMDRLHVTRSYAEKLQTRSRCGLRAPNVLDRLNGLGERGLNLR